MDREYEDDELRRLATGAGIRPGGWDAEEVADFRILVQCARAARLDTDLRNMRMLRIEPDSAGDPKRARATLSSGRVVNLTFKYADGHGVVVFESLTAEMETPR